MTTDGPRVLAINGGSSSIKFALYQVRGVLTQVLHGKIDRVGLRGTTLTFDDQRRRQQESRVIGDLDHGLAVTFLIDWLQQHLDLASLAAVGHRVVTGGARYFEAQRVTEELLVALRGISAYAPDHLPSELAVIERLRDRMPNVSFCSAHCPTLENTSACCLP